MSDALSRHWSREAIAFRNARVTMKTLPAHSSVAYLRAHTIGLHLISNSVYDWRHHTPMPGVRQTNGSRAVVRPAMGDWRSLEFQEKGAGHLQPPPSRYSPRLSIPRLNYAATLARLRPSRKRFLPYSKHLPGDMPVFRACSANFGHTLPNEIHAPRIAN